MNDASAVSATLRTRPTERRMNRGCSRLSKERELSVFHELVIETFTLFCYAFHGCVTKVGTPFFSSLRTL